MSKEEKENFVVRGSGTSLQKSSSNSLQDQYPNIHQSEPLWKRAPTRDADGKPYNDFMMIIPGLKDFEPARLRKVIEKLEAVFKYYEKDIVLADLNLKINVLWVTIQSRIGLSIEIAALIHHAVPEAKLVAD